MLDKPRAALLYLQRRLTRIETWLAGLSLLLLLALTLAQIIARNLFETGLPMADSITRYLVLYVTFFGAALAVDSQRHIRIDVVSAWLSDAWLDRLHRPLHLLAGVVCLLLTQAAVRFWLDEWQYAAMQVRWQVLVNLILPLGFGLLTLHFLLATLIGPQHRLPRL
jgi:TRAP-type transport system small permease protein